MKLATEIQNSSSSEEMTLQLPFGLIGLPYLTNFSISMVEDSWPFMSMKSNGEERVEFIVIDPSGLIPDYEIEVSDEDADALQLKGSEDALVLNIVTIHSSRRQFVTVNLVGPVVVNRHSGIGKQVIVQNWNRFSAKYPLIDERARQTAA
jgi:flagellar assembly factor FliW